MIVDFSIHKIKKNKMNNLNLNSLANFSQQQQQGVGLGILSTLPNSIPAKTSSATITIGSNNNLIDQTYTFTQVTPATLWTINHNLGKFPSVTIVDPSGNAVMSNYRYINNNQIVVTFSAPFAGNAYLN